MRRTYRNAAEEGFCQAAELNGWTPRKRGWPDFWMRGPNGELAVVEVKPHAGRKLKKDQRAVMDLLARHGVRCFKWTPDGGFEEVEPRGEPTEGGEAGTPDGEAEEVA